MNLGVGAYRDDDGRPHVLKCVRKAETMITNAGLDHEYAGIGGVAAFPPLAAKLALGDNCPALADGRVAALQSISGTGANRVAMAFAAQWLGKGGAGASAIAMPDPTWGNHIPIAKHAGLDVVRYRYYSPENNGLDFAGMMDDLSKLEAGTPVLLHACAHNPTGVDPSLEQWREISACLADKGLFPLVDMAYQGFASGDVDADAAAVRTLVADGHDLILCTSFAKNMGLYGERTGALIFVTSTPEQATAVESQAKILIRPMYSNPPIYGARIVETDLSSPELHALWLTEVADMADRIIDVRTTLRNGLAAAGSPHNWSHITDQIGMFCYSGLTADHVAALAADHAVYLTADGRISMAGVNSSNVDHLIAAIHDVTKDSALN
ncbi:aspartate aminotransferase [Thecamonas trahens ATCC 50062]|uniref:aspartate transaminase n=1 Tax=Thecamonas trahens ATCC 50062 TaxID=461836 RepID=A0A0L0DC22_THETB|nr:aspartate aminotransferase [Thecamonas trahens ATCC 50062]KNC49892.1 aspartate aminotransferase [Thecamonas trahens ATCC 50062]|eukprot:XP_013757374.1 aspartate aminotransferase [Thecamonas trahens ATCC 50062]